jgi:hypothetical protein
MFSGACASALVHRLVGLDLVNVYTIRTLGAIFSWLCDGKAAALGGDFQVVSVTSIPRVSELWQFISGRCGFIMLLITGKRLQELKRPIFFCWLNKSIFFSARWRIRSCVYGNTGKFFFQGIATSHFV